MVKYLNFISLLLPARYLKNKWVTVLIAPHHCYQLINKRTLLQFMAKKKTFTFLRFKFNTELLPVVCALAVRKSYMWAWHEMNRWKIKESSRWRIDSTWPVFSWCLLGWPSGHFCTCRDGNGSSSELALLTACCCYSPRLFFTRHDQGHFLTPQPLIAVIVPPFSFSYSPTMNFAK